MAANLFVAADYSGLELRTVAQACLRLVGYSRLAEALNGGLDAHSKLASGMLGRPYEEVHAAYKAGDPEVGNTRTAAKGMNFGFPGGLGPNSFPAYAWKAYKVRITPEQTAAHKVTWLETYPEFQDYARFIRTLRGEDGRYTVRHLFSERLRAGCTFTSASNSFFQGLGADAAGAAVFEVAAACYVPDPRPERAALFGSRIVNFVHDEIILECPAAGRFAPWEVAAALERTMVDAAAPYLPDVPPEVDSKIMRYWSKDAVALHDAAGNLTAWPNRESVCADRVTAGTRRAKALAAAKDDADRVKAEKKYEETMLRLAEQERRLRANGVWE